MPDRLCGVGILDEEIMARYICSGSNVSLITLKALAEIGYEIDYDLAEDYRVRTSGNPSAVEMGVSVHEPSLWRR